MSGAASSTDPEIKKQVLRALTDAVQSSLSGMALVDAVPIPPKSAKRSRSPVCWSWIKLEQPCSGQLVVLQPVEFGRIIAEVMTGIPPEEIPDEDVLDAQTELTNVIAGRFLQAFADSEAPPSLGLPRCGRGAPDVRRGEWIGQVYKVGQWWVAMFLTGKDIIGSKASVRLASVSSPAEVRMSQALGSIGDEDATGNYEPNTMQANVRPGAATRPAGEPSITEDELQTLPHNKVEAVPEPMPGADIEVELPEGVKASDEIPATVRDSVLLSPEAKPVPVVRLEDFIKDHPSEFPGAASDVYQRTPPTQMPVGTTARTDAVTNEDETAEAPVLEDGTLAEMDPDATMPMSGEFAAEAARIARGEDDGSSTGGSSRIHPPSSGSGRMHPPSSTTGSSSSSGVSSVSGDAMEVGLGDMIGDGDFLIPSRLGNYRIIEEIGAGGMATVFRGEHATLLRQVAIKVLKPSLAMDKSFITGFLQEARNAARVEHPNVVPVYDADEVDGYLYIVLRLVPSGDLSTRVSCHGVLSEEEACMVFRACCAGLGAIAEAGMMHRDLKPSNILIGEDGTPLIGDLGLTRPASFGATRSGNAAGAIGTPSYMAPEQIEQDPDLDIRCDIYGLGGTLFTAVTGRPPYRGKNAAETISKVIREPVPDPRDHASGLTEDFAKLIMKALAKERADRFQNPMEFGRALDACLKKFDSANQKKGWFGRLFKGG